MNRLWLTSEQNGLINLLISISLITGSLSNLGMAGVTTRLFPHFRSQVNRHYGFLFYPLVISIVGFMFFLILFFIFRDELIERNLEKSRLFAENLYYLIPLTFFIGIFYILDAYSRSVYLTTAGVIVKEVLLRIVILIAAWFYHTGSITFDTFVLIYCSSFCAMGVALAIYLWRKNEFHLKPDHHFIDGPLRKEIFYVALFSIITGLSSLIINSIDKLIVNDKLGLASAGIFAIATYFGSIIQIPARSLVRISSSVIADSWKNNDLENIRSVYHQTCLNQLIVGTLLLLGIWVNLDTILGLMPSEYSEGRYVIILMAIAYLIDMATGVNGVIIGTSRHFRFDTYFMVFLVVITVIANLMLIPQYGITGAAIASCITYFSYNFLRYLFIWWKFGMQPYDLSFLKVIGFAVLAFFASTLLPALPWAYADIIMRGTAVCGSFGMMIYWARISPQLNDTSWKMIRQVIALGKFGKKKP